ncbi:MAG TPA: histidine kinase [Steroidobacteraceae bacterium]|nr:histidine kinase [Steroidobacteraceae bacterium]
MVSIDPLLKNRTAQFWTLQIGGWLAYALSQFLGTLLYDTKYENMKGYVTVIMIATVSGFLLSLELRYIYRRLWLRSPRVLIVVALLSCYVFALIWRVIINSAYLQYTSESMEWVMKSPLEFFSNAMHSTYLLLCWTGIYFGIKYYESAQQQREASLRAAALAQEAQLKMLRYQLNPHFLFNTLNAISTLILDNENRTANQTVMRLSEFLRYTLDQDPMKKVTLRQEVEAMNLYLTTERLRFGERLRLEIAVEERALEALVPSLLLQPLIENAVKYAVSPSEQGGTIRVEGRARGVMLELAVADDGPGLNTGAAPGAGRGVGLRNTRERLAVLYEDRHRFATLDNKPGLRIELGLPLEMAPA